MTTIGRWVVTLWEAFWKTFKPWLTGKDYRLLLGKDQPLSTEVSYLSLWEGIISPTAGERVNVIKVSRNWNLLSPLHTKIHYTNLLVWSVKGIFGSTICQEWYKYVSFLLHFLLPSFLFLLFLFGRVFWILFSFDSFILFFGSCWWYEVIFGRKIVYSYEGGERRHYDLRQEIEDWDEYADRIRLIVETHPSYKGFERYSDMWLWFWFWIGWEINCESAFYQGYSQARNWGWISYYWPLYWVFRDIRVGIAMERLLLILFVFIIQTVLLRCFVIQ